jgi:hypothetical protein
VSFIAAIEKHPVVRRALGASIPGFGAELCSCLTATGDKLHPPTELCDVAQMRKQTCAEEK